VTSESINTITTFVRCATQQ